MYHIFCNFYRCLIIWIKIISIFFFFNSQLPVIIISCSPKNIVFNKVMISSSNSICDINRFRKRIFFKILDDVCVISRENIFCSSILPRCFFSFIKVCLRLYEKAACNQNTSHCQHYNSTFHEILLILWCPVRLKYLHYKISFYNIVVSNKCQIVVLYIILMVS